MGIMVWSPLGSGLLSGKYKPSQSRDFGAGRLQTLKDTNNPAFNKFTDRNFAIVTELEQVAREVGRSMAQVAINWVANQPGVATVLVGATRQSQLDDNLASLDFELPVALRSRLDAVSAPAASSPYVFFTPGMQAMLTGVNAVGNKQPGYTAPVLIDAIPARV
jgi:aryl-alcohol dehydrogenase-like predicted oxidoreductase